MSDSFQELKTKLDNHHNWPEDYVFKFVVPKEQIDELLMVLPEGKMSQKESKTGKYIALTLVLYVITVMKSLMYIKKLLKLKILFLYKKSSL